MEKQFRYLILISFALYVLWFYFPYIDPLFFEVDRLNVWAMSGFDAKYDFPLWHYYLWLVLHAVIAVGLYQFNAWSRDLLIVSYILGFFLGPLYGTFIESPISAAIGSLVTLIDGVIIGMAYFSPVASRFKRGAP